MGHDNNQSVRNDRIPEFNDRVEMALGLTRGDPTFERDYISPVNQGRFAAIGRLESGVSMLQTAKLNMNKLKGWLQEMKDFLENAKDHPPRGKISEPVSSYDFLADRLSKMKTATETVSFQGRALFNGISGVKGRTIGDNLRFVRGTARVVSSESPGYPLAIYQAAKPSILVGSNQISSEVLQEEKLIALTDGSREVRYRIKKNETPDSLIENLQQCFDDDGFEVNVGYTGDNYLLFRHNQLGSRARFYGVSHYSSLVSEVPGQYKAADLGIDIAGTIGSESAHGDGGFLIGDKGSPKIDGLVVFYDGDIDYPGQIVGYVDVRQNGIKVPLDEYERRQEMISIPSIEPHNLSVGVSNSSGFTDLADIRASNKKEQKDALRMISWAYIYLGYLQDELELKENFYTERTIELLRSTADPRPVEETYMYVSKGKAVNMADQLKTMMTFS